MRKECCFNLDPSPPFNHGLPFLHSELRRGESFGLSHLSRIGAPYTSSLRLEMMLCLDRIRGLRFSLAPPRHRFSLGSWFLTFGQVWGLPNLLRAGAALHFSLVFPRSFFKPEYPPLEFILVLLLRLTPLFLRFFKWSRRPLAFLAVFSPVCAAILEHFTPVLPVLDPPPLRVFWSLSIFSSLPPSELFSPLPSLTEIDRHHLGFPVHPESVPEGLLSFPGPVCRPPLPYFPRRPLFGFLPFLPPFCLPSSEVRCTTPLTREHGLVSSLLHSSLTPTGSVVLGRIPNHRRYGSYSLS